MSGREENGGEEREQRGPMAMVAKVGAVVTTLGALVALVVGVKGLLPSDEDPVGAVGKIEKLDLNSVAPISEASRKVPDATDCPGVEELPRFRVRRPTSPVAVASIGLPIAVAQEDSQSYAQDPGTEGETPDPLPTEPEESTEPEGDTDGEPGEGEDDSPDPTTPRPQRIEPGDPRTLADLQQDTDLPTPEIEQLMFSPPPGEAGDLTQAQVAGIIENTRKDDPSSPDSEPLGWLIDVTTRLENLTDKCAYVQWSLYDAKTLRRVRYAWVTDRRGARFVARASPDARSSTFWVPAPIERRRYMVRVALYDAEATRLDLGRIRLPR